jgi:hypothetical protein
MKLFQKIKKWVSNPHIYTALIAAAILLGSSWFFKTAENKDFFVILYASIACTQMFVAKALVKKNKRNCQTVCARSN